jgi:5-methylcytosine-specific restriction endonuclease McrA
MAIEPITKSGSVQLWARAEAAVSMKVNDTVRLRIWRRDNFKCRYCDYDAIDSFESFRRARLAVDHLKPSGGDDDSNLVTCCAACNADKGSADFDSVESVRRFLRLYWKECSRPWFNTFVTTHNRSKNPSNWNWKERLEKVRARFAAGDDEPE